MDTELLHHGNEAFTYSNLNTSQKTITQLAYSYVAIQIKNGNEFHGYFNGQESGTATISAINVDLNDLKIRSVSDSSRIDELIIANDNVYFVNSGEWTLPQ